MAEQPVKLSTVPCLCVFSRAEQSVLQALEYQQVKTRNAIAQAVAIGLLKKTGAPPLTALSRFLTF
jgi:hypothetical protein